MTNSRTIQSVPIGALRTDDPCIVVYTNVYCIPVFRDEKIIWFDIYTKAQGWYLGKITHLDYLEEAYEISRNSSD